MNDVIVYVSDFQKLVDFLSQHYPDLLLHREDGALQQPPVVIGFARTPAVVSGNLLLIYARLTDDDFRQWSNIPHAEILAEAPFSGTGTGDTVYQQIWNDPQKLAIYNSIYNRSSKKLDDGEGGIITITPPAKFGILAGA